MRRVSQLTQAFLGNDPRGMRTAVVATSDLSFGLSRMYRTLSDLTSETVTVFRDADEAMKWLDVSPVPLAELHGESTDAAS